MKLDSVTTVNIDQAGYRSQSAIRPYVRRGYFDRISQVAERGVLVFVVLVTMLSGYVNHSYLMRDVLVL